MEIQNESEKIFEQYLDLNGFRDKWKYEPEIPGKLKKLDYLLNHNGGKYFFDVKELRKKPNEPNRPACFDPYQSLRTEIQEVRKQFKEYREYCCSLVVFNVDDRQAILAPLFVFSAMLGNLGFATTFNATEGKAVEGSGKNVFLDGGKMTNYKRRKPHNTTISAIIILNDKFPDDSEIQKAIKDEMKKQSNSLTDIERFAIIEEIIKDHPGSYITRVVVIENPYARIAFPDGLFVEPFDERWRWTMQNGELKRVFAENKLKDLEELKNKG